MAFVCRVADCFQLLGHIYIPYLVGILRHLGFSLWTPCIFVFNELRPEEHSYSMELPNAVTTAWPLFDTTFLFIHQNDTL
jgi:hypothetical protein